MACLLRSLRWASIALLWGFASSFVHAQKNKARTSLPNLAGRLSVDKQTPLDDSAQRYLLSSSSIMISVTKSPQCKAYKWPHAASRFSRVRLLRPLSHRKKSNVLLH
jgi:hypothetical protein